MSAFQDLLGFRRGRMTAAATGPAAITILVFVLFLPAHLDALSPELQPPLSVQLPSDQLPQAILDPARRLLSALRLHEVASVEERLDTLVALRRAALIADLTPVAAAFVARFKDESPALDPEEAIRLAWKAVDLAPDFPPLYFNIASAYWTHEPTSFGPMLRALLEGLRAYARYPRGLATLMGNLAFRLSLTLSIAISLLAALILIRHVRRLVHDAGDLFPAAPSRVFSASEIARSRRARFITQSGLARILAASFTGLALILPLFFGLGLIGTSLVWLVVIAPYLRRGEETAVAAIPFLFAFFLVPLAILTGLPLALERAEGPLLWRCAHESCGSNDLATLEAIAARDTSDRQAAMTLALAHVHWAPSDTRLLSMSLRRLEQTSPDETVALLRADLLLLLAVSECDAGPLDRDSLSEARKAFESLPASSPLVPEALRGLALAQGLLGERTEMEATLSRLVQVIPERELGSIMRIRTVTGRENPCAQAAAIREEIRPPSVPDIPLALRGTSLTDVAPVLPFETTFLGTIPVQVLLWTPVAFPVWLVAVRIGRRRDIAYVCARCGDVTCGACNLRASGFDYCPTCLLEQVRPGFIDPLDLLSLQGRREAENRLGRVAIPFISLVLPGAGQVLRGRTLRGLLFLGGVALAWSLVAYPLPLHVDIEGFTGPPSGALPALPPLLLAMIYFVSALDVWADRKR